MGNIMRLTKSCFIVLAVIPFCSSKSGFIKDQGMNVVFPPLVKRHGSGIPEGHLRPLGHQRSPDGQVEQEMMLTPQEFYDMHVHRGEPVVFRKAIMDIPALTKWGQDDEDKYLNDKYGDLDVLVTVKKEVFKKGPKKMKLSQFLSDYMYENWYLSTTAPQQMMQELVLPKCLQCGTFRKYLQESELWMSSGGTTSMLHYHADHNLHCVVTGRKDFILIHPEHKETFEMVEHPAHSGHGYSKIDMDMVNVFKHPEITQVPWTYSTLKPGDCIYVPAGHLHQVRSYGRSISYTILWAPVPQFSASDCEGKPDRDIPLSEVTFTWAYFAGDKQLSNARLNSESLRHHLLALLRMDSALSYERWAAFYEEVMAQMDDFPDADEVFQILNSSDKSYLTRKELLEMEKSKLQKVANILNLPQGSSTIQEEPRPRDEL
ncbi:uncharacterized protein LOC106151697 [Lingula anatina]|uniref:Uncharacterized protein LOC106151697 n=1 Tax=Lingula anatina TaxID=7574 RepID=A0A1S3H325_LINAN|nr:uncharacterized protein LOC106151697 [Lingula anatina]|eukprot:XP_013380535.1 uncharacterized protein LOC106151697 [Lingula anatina]